MRDLKIFVVKGRVPVLKKMENRRSTVPEKACTIVHDIS